ncbi:hypothetical protein ACFQZ8_25785, partial [Micromonospora azadirachtae]
HDIVFLQPNRDLCEAGDDEGFAVLFPPGPPAAGIALEAGEVTFDISGTATDLAVRLTNTGTADATGRTDVLLPAAVGADLVFDLHTAPMALAMVLLQAICDATPADTQRRLEAFEASAARRQLFLD